MNNPVRFIDPDGMWPWPTSPIIMPQALMAFCQAIYDGAVKSDQKLESLQGKNKNINVPGGVNMKNKNGEVQGNSKDLNYVKKSTPLLEIKFQAFQGATEVIDAIGKYNDQHPDSKKSDNNKLTDDRNTKVNKEEKEAVTPQEESQKPETEGNIDILNKDGSWGFDRYEGKTDSARKVTNLNNKNNVENGYKYENAVKIIPNPY